MEEHKYVHEVQPFSVDVDRAEGRVDVVEWLETASKKRYDGSRSMSSQ